jgi:hypothetical protein
MDGRVDGDNATQFIAAYQTVEPLKLGELWAFPIMLQLALLENLRRVGVRIAQRREERDAAIIWADRMLATAESEPKQLIHLLAEFANADVPLTAPFVEEFTTGSRRRPAMTCKPGSVPVRTGGDRTARCRRPAARRGQPDLHRKQHRQPALHRRHGLEKLRRVAQCRRTDLARGPGGNARGPGFRHARPVPACH